MIRALLAFAFGWLAMHWGLKRWPPSRERRMAVLRILERETLYSLEIAEKSREITGRAWPIWLSPLTTLYRLEAEGLIQRSIVDKSTPEIRARRGGNAPTYWTLTEEGKRELARQR